MTLRRVSVRVLNIFRRKGLEAQMRDEMEANLQIHIDENIARGLSPEEARRQALIRLGCMEATKEAYRDQRGVPWFENLLRDLRYGLRILVKAPGFAAVAVLSLALGIGANTAIFSIVNAVLVRPLPYAHPERLVVVSELDNENRTTNATFATWTDWRRESGSFADLALIASWTPTANGEGGAEQLTGARVTNNFFRTLGVRPFLGRDFTPEEDNPNGNKVVLLTYGLWKRRYGSDPNIAGKSISLNQTSYLVAGVLPEAFQALIYRQDSGDDYEIFRVLGYAASQPSACRTCHHLFAIGRLRDGVTREQAQAEMNRIQHSLKLRYPKEYSGDGVLLQPMQQQIVASAAPTLRLLLGAVGFVLLIACANVANLLLARSSYRRREISVRMALGASRSRIVSQLLTENCLLALLAAVIGLAPAYWTPSMVRYFGGGRIPRLEEVHLDVTVVLFAVLIATATGLLSGIVPALRISGQRFQESLAQGSRGSSRASWGTNSALVAVEVCLSLTLLIGAGLLLRSMVRVLNVNPGFDPQNTLTLRLSLAGAKYTNNDVVRQFYADVIDRISALPDVKAAGAASQVPFGGNMDGYGFHPQDKMNPNPELDPSAERYAVTPGYFESMRLPLFAGRAFARTDTATSPPVVIVNRELARRIWPGEDPIGKQMKIGGLNGPWYTVVGVAGDVHHYALDADPTMQLYVPHAQWRNTDSDMTIVLRTTADPENVIGTVQQAVRSLDGNQPISHVQTFRAMIGVSNSARRFVLFLTGAFSGLALLLAAVGVYGVTAYAVAQRTREIGIRMALGATPRTLLRMVLGSGLTMTLAGAAMGIVTALAMTRTLTSMLFGVAPSDPVTFVGVTAILIAVATIACWIPARRVTRVDPQLVLRQE